MKWKKICRNSENENTWHCIVPQDDVDDSKKLSPKTTDVDENFDGLTTKKNTKSSGEDQKNIQKDIGEHGTGKREAKREINPVTTLHKTMDDLTSTINQLRLEISEQKTLNNEHDRKICKLSQQLEGLENECEHLKMENSRLTESEKHAIRLKTYYRRLVTDHIAFQDIVDPSDNDLLKDKLKQNGAVLASLSQEMLKRKHEKKSRPCISMPPRSKSYVCSSINYETKQSKQKDELPLSKSNIETTHKHKIPTQDSHLKSSEVSPPLENANVTNMPDTEPSKTSPKENTEVNPSLDSETDSINNLRESVKKEIKKLDGIIDDVGNIKCPF